ncbi:hypothetical protein, partial [Bradyrhizobium sp.]|uniref:hypothetical protein n=1 Tax=Bradyrhizobium sp. TaxID=376 RepID=UPI00391CA96E
DFAFRLKSMTAVQTAARKDSSFVFPEFNVCWAQTASGRGRIAVVTTREAGSDGRDGSLQSLRECRRTVRCGR